MESIGSVSLWTGFVLFVVALLALDLGVFHRKAHVVGLKESALWSLIWVGLASIFNGWIYIRFGTERGLEFTSGYLIEKALAVDNIFVFVVIFAAFGIPAIYQHRVLFWGVLGALIMRTGFILAGGAMLDAFHWMIYVFGAILLLTGAKLLFQEHRKFRPEDNPLVRLFRWLMPVTQNLEGDRFLVRRDGRWMATPLLMALVAVEFTDLIFAIDSIPAIFAITRDPFIVFTSNIFAILGLRSLYFLLAGVIDRFVYLKHGLSLVLILVGGKMLVMDWFKIPVHVSLGVIAAILGGSIILSFIKTRTGSGTLK